MLYYVLLKIIWEKIELTENADDDYGDKIESYALIQIILKMNKKMNKKIKRPRIDLTLIKVELDQRLEKFRTQKNQIQKKALLLKDDLKQVYEKAGPLARQNMKLPKALIDLVFNIVDLPSPF